MGLFYSIVKDVSWRQHGYCVRSFQFPVHFLCPFDCTLSPHRLSSFHFQFPPWLTSSISTPSSLLNFAPWIIVGCVRGLALIPGSGGLKPWLPLVHCTRLWFNTLEALSFSFINSQVVVSEDLHSSQAVVASKLGQGGKSNKLGQVGKALTNLST